MNWLIYIKSQKKRYNNNILQDNNNWNIILRFKSQNNIIPLNMIIAIYRIIIRTKKISLNSYQANNKKQCNKYKDRNILYNREEILAIQINYAKSRFKKEKLRNNKSIILMVIEKYIVKKIIFHLKSIITYKKRQHFKEWELRPVKNNKRGNERPLIIVRIDKFLNNSYINYIRNKTKILI